VILKNSINGIKAQGAQDVVLKEDNFTAKNGALGKKGSGTFTQLNPITKSSSKLFYHVIVFGEEGGIQQVLITHTEGDDYGSQIAERICQSVELKKAKSND
jgi:hypothetical protein